MMKTIRNNSLIVLCLLLSSMVFSRGNYEDLSKSLKRKNIVDLTIGGTGLFVSANYSRIISVKSNYFIDASVGIGSVPYIGGISLPHQLTFNFGKQSSFWELGVGGTYWSGKSNASAYTETINSYQISPIIGWRKNFKNNLIFRVYANPLIRISGENYIEDYSIVPYLGVSLGYTF